MRTIRCWTASLAATTAAATAAVLGTAGPVLAVDNLPIPKVEIRSTAYIANDYSAFVRLWLRCDDFGTVERLVVDVEQGSVSGHLEGTFGIECDGDGKQFDLRVVTNGPSFEEGPANVRADLTVTYPDYPGTGPHTGTAEKTIRMAPPGDARIDLVKLNPDGTLAVQIALKCYPQFLSQGWTLAASQPVSAASGGRSDPVQPECNNVWQGYRFKVRPAPGSPAFVHGKTTVVVAFTLVDLDNGDPVGAINKRQTLMI